MSSNKVKNIWRLLNDIPNEGRAFYRKAINTFAEALEENKRTPLRGNFDIGDEDLFILDLGPLAYEGHREIVNLIRRHLGVRLDNEQNLKAPLNRESEGVTVASVQEELFSAFVSEVTIEENRHKRSLADHVVTMEAEHPVKDLRTGNDVDLSVSFVVATKSTLEKFGFVLSEDGKSFSLPGTAPAVS